MTNEELLYMDKKRFEMIYKFSEGKPSWEVVGVKVGGVEITEEDYLFVMQNTHQKLKEKKKYG